MPLLSALIDQREPPGIRAMRLPGVSLTVALLDSGDFLGVRDDDDCILVERKTVGDLLGSIADNRLLDQAGRMAGFTRWSYLVITGSLVPDGAGHVLLDGRSSNWEWAAIQGSLLKVQELGVAVVHALSDADYPHVLARLGNRSHGTIRVPPRRAALPLSVGEVILTALPGIGEHHARQLLDACISPAWALTYLSELAPLPAIPGIGAATRQRVRAALGLIEDEYLSVVNFEGQIAPSRMARLEQQERTA